MLESRACLTEDPELRRRRLGVLFRPVLVLPAVALSAGWSLVALLILPLAWIAALITGRVPRRAHRLLRAALEYQSRVTAWFDLVSGTYPRFPGRRGHPVRLAANRAQQPRWTILLRIPLALPALVLATVFGTVLAATGVAAWLVALLRGRTTAGLRELGFFCLRYQTETLAYIQLLTPRAPRLEQPSEPEGEADLEAASAVEF